MLEIWSIRCKANPETWDQVHLAQAIEDKALSINFLPIEYCMIFDSPHASSKVPYIVHNQASRKPRRQLMSGEHDNLAADETGTASTDVNDDVGEGNV